MREVIVEYEYTDKPINLGRALLLLIKETLENDPELRHRVDEIGEMEGGKV